MRIGGMLARGGSLPVKGLSPKRRAPRVLLLRRGQAGAKRAPDRTLAGRPFRERSADVRTRPLRPAEQVRGAMTKPVSRVLLSQGAIRCSPRAWWKGSESRKQDAIIEEGRPALAANPEDTHTIRRGVQ